MAKQKKDAGVDTDAIRARMGQGLWGGTITTLCDEVDRLADELDAATLILADDAIKITDLERQRDELADRFEAATAEPDDDEADEAA